MSLNDASSGPATQRAGNRELTDLRKVLAGLFLVIVAWWFLAHRLSGETLWQRDLQCLRAEIIREMVETGDWLTPRLRGEPYLTKPPLFYWLGALASKAYGAVDDFPLRWPSVVVSGIGAGATAWLGTLLFQSQVGFLAALLLLASPLHFLMARTVHLDPTLAGLVTVAIACFVRSASEVRLTRLFWLLGCLASGASFLVKGPVGLLFIVPAAVAYRRSQTSPPRLAGATWAAGGLVFLAVALPWFVANSGVWDTVARETAGRYGGTGGRPWYFYAPLVLGACAPWTVWLPAFARAARMEASRRAPALWTLAAWCLPALVVFSATPNKRPWYLLPLLPALTIALAWTVSRCIGGEADPVEMRRFRAGLLTAGAAFLVVGVALPPTAARWLPGHPVWPVLAGLALGTCGFATWTLTRRRRTVGGVAALLAAVVVAWGGWLHGIGPDVNAYRTRKPFLREVGRIVGDRPLYAYRYPGEDLPFYTGRLAPVIDDPEALARQMSRASPSFAVADEKDLAALPRGFYRTILEASWRDPVHPERVERLFLLKSDGRTIITDDPGRRREGAGVT